MAELSPDAHLVPVFLKNARGFLRAGADRPGPDAWASRVQMLCCAAELALNALLIAAGRTDEENRREVRHDLQRGLEAARRVGLEPQSDQVTTLIAALSPSYAHHALDQLARQSGRPDLADCVDAVEDLVRRCEELVVVMQAVSLGR